MLIQSNDLGRIFAIFVTQLFVSLFFLTIAFRILRRNRNKLTYNLSCFYIVIALGFIINAILVLLKVNPIVTILYTLAIFLVFFGHAFLITFNLTLLRLDFEISNQKIYLILIIYAVSTFLVITLFNGFEINERTNWRPVWTWIFLFILYLFITCFFLVPNIFLSIKLFKAFRDSELRKKMKHFFIGTCFSFLALYGLLLYTTWNNIIYRTFWTFAGLFIVIIFGLLIYYSIGSEI